MNSIHTGAEPALPEQLARVDLNLLVAFDALARERNVTRAAERVGVTQSAMSHSLRRLRELFADELLVRGKSGMLLTARAEALVVPLQSGLMTLSRALCQVGEFDARSAKRAFRIASPDLFDVLAIPPLLSRIRRDAPQVDVTLVPAQDPQLAERLETGEVDVAVIPLLRDAGSDVFQLETPSLLRRTLLRDRFACFIRSDHPALRKQGSGTKKSLSLRAFTELSHALVSPSGHGPGLVDRVLAERGLSRRVALRVPHFNSALAIVSKSDLVLTAPRALASLLGRLSVVALPPPLALPEHSINLVWHARFSDDPGHRWLRELLVEIAHELR